MERRDVEVSELLLWEANPRVEQSSSQDEEIEKIYDSGTNARAETSRRQLMNLAESIAEEGFRSEVHPVLVLESEDKLIVKDGNRRVAALKLLNAPDRYSAFLSKAHLKKLTGLREEYQGIPSTIEVVVYGPDEEEKLDETLGRIHQGVLDGVGVVPWTAEATARFFSKATFSDQFETPFKEQYGSTLTSYLGGNKAITNRRRIFEYAPVKKYLGADCDEVDISPELLDKIKRLADAVKEYAQERDMPLSRFRVKDVKVVLEHMGEGSVPPGDGEPEPKPGQGQGAASSGDSTADKARGETNKLALRTFEEYSQQYVSVRHAHLGGQYLKAEYFDFENESFGDLNFLLAALQQFGANVGDDSVRLSRNAILSPSIRLFYELSLLVLQNNGILDRSVGVSANHASNVENVVHSMLAEQEFIRFLSEQRRGAFNGFRHAKSSIEGTGFRESIAVSNITAHSSITTLTEDQVRAAFQSAVLFALLTQAYVTFKA